MRFELQARQHRRRQAAVVLVGLAAADRVEQAHRLRHLAGRHQRGDVGVVAEHLAQVVLGLAVVAAGIAGRVLDAALFDQGGEAGGLFRAAAEADRDQADLRLRVLFQPTRRLIDEPSVHLLQAPFVGVSGGLVVVTRRPTLLGAGPGHVADPDALMAALIERVDLVAQVADVGQRVGAVGVVAGAVEGGDEQALVRVVGVQEHRHAQVAHLFARIGVLGHVHIAHRMRDDAVAGALQLRVGCHRPRRGVAAGDFRRLVSVVVVGWPHKLSSGLRAGRLGAAAGGSGAAMSRVSVL
jgi:hypothetical protein